MTVYFVYQWETLYNAVLAYFISIYDTTHTLVQDDSTEEDTAMRQSLLPSNITINYPVYTYSK